MADLGQHLQDSLSLHEPQHDQTLQKKRSQRFTVQRQPSQPPPALPAYAPHDAYLQPGMDRTLSTDSSESLPYGYAPQAPVWFNPVIARPDMSAFVHPPISPSHPMAHDPHALMNQPSLLPGQEDVSDEIIPTAIVIKNIPFSVPREQVMSIMDALQLTPPYAFNYHYDIGPGSTSTFRGLAFANFRDPAETTAALAALNGYEIQGRRLRVEYKRVLRHGEKEKIEREKALKRMRSAAGLNNNGLPVYQMPPPLPLSPEDDFAHAMHHPPQPNAFDASSSVWGTPSQAGAPSPASFAQPVPPFSHASTAPLSIGSPGSSDIGSGVEQSSQSSSVPASAAAKAPAPAAKAELDMNDPQTLEIYSRVLLFKDDSLRDELAFARSLTGIQRRSVHLVAQKLGLEHKSVGEGEDRHVVVFKSSANGLIDETQKPPMARISSSSNLRSKKSEPNMRPTPPSSNTFNHRKSNADLRSAARRDRSLAGVQGVFQHPSGPVPPLPTLRTAGSFDESTNVNGAVSSPLRQPRGPMDRGSPLPPGRSSQASNWRSPLDLA